MSAMPERVWLIPDPYAMSGDWWADGKTVREDGEVPYVPESRLLAAEARVREVQTSALTARDAAYKAEHDCATLRAERDALRARVREVEAEQDEAQMGYDGWRGNYVALKEATAALRAERDALVPLLRYFVEYVEDGTYDDEDGGQAPTHDCDFIGNPESGYCEFHDKWGTARAILAREGA